MKLNNLFIRNKLLLGNIIPLLLMIVIAIIVIINIRKVEQTSSWVQHTQAVIAQGNLLTKQLIDMETGERGFLITGDETFLEPYTVGRLRFDKTLTQLIDTVSDNPTQVSKLQQIRSLENQWQEIAAIPEIDARRRSRQSKAYREMGITDVSLVDVVALIKSGNGKNVMDELRQQLEEFVSAEQFLMHVRQKEALASHQFTFNMTIIGTLIALLITALSSLIIGRRIANRMRTELELDLSYKMLAKISSIQSNFILDGNPKTAFDGLLEKLLELTDSDYGFIGEVHHKVDGEPYLKTHAITNIAWNEETLKFYEENAPQGLEFLNLKSLFGEVVTTGQPIIANDPYNDPRRCGLPSGHPALNSFLGLPFHIGDRLVGMAGIANRPNGYDEEIVELLSPLMMTCGNLVAALESERQKCSAEEALKNQKLVLEKQQKDLILAKTEAEAGAKTKAEFLATMSHEIRTPLNGIIGMTGLLMDTKLTVEQTDFLETVRMSGDHLLAVINNILDFSKIESDQMVLEVQPFELRNCVEEVFDLTVPTIGDKSLELLNLMDSDVPRFIVGDVTRLRQVLVNLTYNAIKFSQKGNIQIAVCKTEGSQLQFSVKDTGIGIPVEKIDNLFEAFTQLDSSTTRRYGGSGLGLSISARLVDLMGGKIWVESEEGVGSTFFFTIDMVEATVPLRKYHRGDLAEIQGKRVLIVDDNQTNLRILTLQFERWGMQPISFDTSLNALAAVQQDTLFDIGILDMDMPTMDGLELGKKIRKLRSEEKLPLVLLSSVDFGNGLTSQCRDPFCASISKPIKQSALFDLIVGVITGEAPSKGVVTEQRDIAYDLAERLPLKILLVEDNMINQKLALRILERMGYHADMAGNGLEALQALERQAYDIIFMDMQMPEMDGLKASRQITQDRPVEQRPIIIAMTANTLAGDRERCLEAGMDDYIAKPVSIPEIQMVLQRWGKVVQQQQTQPETLEQGQSEVPKTSVTLEDILDLNIVGEMQNEDPEFFQEFIPVLFKECQERIQAIRNFADMGNLDILKDEVHILKGTCMGVGAQKLVHLCQDIEARLKAGLFRESKILIDQLKPVYEQTKIQLSEFC